jgi:hypothetical protein
VRRLRSRLNGRVLYAGQSYYHAWYLSRELRKLGWRADVLNWDSNPRSQLYYHGEDFRLGTARRFNLAQQLAFYAWAATRYDIFHFSNPWGMHFGDRMAGFVSKRFGESAEVRLLKGLGKKIVYSYSGCLDGVTQSRFNAWGPEPTCEICPWRERPEICSDERNNAWGRLRNSLADYQVMTGGNRADWNNDPTIHEVPEFFCLDPDIWRPDLEVPSRLRLAMAPSTFKLYHAVGNADTRSAEGTGVGLKSSHIWFPLVDQLRAEGRDVELYYFTDVPNLDVRFYQVQADVICDMLTFGWFGANVREAMMLGKAAIGFLRPEWFEIVRRELPGYVEELPVVSATPETVRETLIELMDDEPRRRELGQRGREFAVKWHSSAAGARRFDTIYSELVDA